MAKQISTKNRIEGNLMLFGAALIWGCSFPIQKTGVMASTPLIFGAARTVLSAFCLWLIVINTRKKVDRHTVLGGLVCGTFLTFATITQQYGLVTESAGKSAFITALYMVLIPIFGRILFKHKPRRVTWICVVIAMAGLYFVCMDPSDDFKLGKGDIWLLLCAAGFALQMISADRFLRKSDPIVLSAVQFTVCAILNVSIVIVLKDGDPAQLTGVIWPILYCGIFSGAAGYTLQLAGQKKTNAMLSALISSLESVFAVAFGALFLKEILTRRELIGCALLFAAVIIVQMPFGKKKKA